MQIELVRFDPKIARLRERVGLAVVGQKGFPTAVVKFLSEGRTGNVTLNIKDGRILGAHVNIIISVKPADKPATINGSQRRPACPT